MFRRSSFLSFLLLLLPIFSFHYSPASSQELVIRDTHPLHRDGAHDHHNPHAQPVLELNETEILMHHSPTPPSYYTIDWEEPENAAKRHSGLIISHALFMGLAFFLALPMGESPPVSFTIPLTSHPCDQASLYVQ